MRYEHALIFSLLIIIFISGCATQQTSCSSNSLTIEDYTLYTRTLYSGGRTGIDFKVVNQGLNTINNVEVNFFDTSAFEISNLECGGTVSGSSCFFTNFYSDAQIVSLKLKAPTVTETTPYTVSFSVHYSGEGERELNMPILNTNEKSTPSLKYSQSSASCDPIQMDFEKEVKAEETQKEYWTTTDMPFEMKFVFTNTGNANDLKNIKISKGDVKLSLTNLEIQEPCDFDSSLYSTKDVYINGDQGDNILKCNFIPIYGSQEEYMGVINAKYEYDYELLKTETFTVYPS
jgi:hypothetical protein